MVYLVKLVRGKATIISHSNFLMWHGYQLGLGEAARNRNETFFRKPSLGEFRLKLNPGLKKRDS
jgi:hypothetical protein